MALVRLATPVAGQTIDPTTHYTTEFDNIYNNALALISPLTGTLNANNNQVTNLRVENVTATPTAGQAGRTVWHTTHKQLILDDGVQLRYVPAVYGLANRRLIIATDVGSYAAGPAIFTTSGSAVMPAMNAAATISTTITAGGAAVGDRVLASHTAVTMASVVMSAYVSSTNTVTVTFYNGTGAVLNIGSGTLAVTILQT